MKNKFKPLLICVSLLFCFQTSTAQIFNFDLWKLRNDWGWFDFERANTARFSMYMGRAQKRTMLYMNLIRQDETKFSELITDPYLATHPKLEKKLKVKLSNKSKHMLYPSFRLWLAAAPHAIVSGAIGSNGHQGFRPRLGVTLNFGNRGENISYGSFKGIDVAFQLLASPPHRANILNEEFARAAVFKFPHSQYGWNSVTCFSGPKFMDLTFRGLEKSKHAQANFGYTTDFSKSILDCGIGMRFNNNVVSSRWSVGAEFIFNNGNTVIAPKVHWANEFYYVGIGANLLTTITESKQAIIGRPEISVRFPFSLNRRGYSYGHLSKSKSSVGFSYGYNINLDKQVESPFQPHQIAMTYTKNFRFRKNK
jgi:hypothetical protein